MNLSLRPLIILGALVSLAGCVVTSQTKPAEPVTSTQLTMLPITYQVPDDPGIIRRSGIIEDLTFASFSNYSPGKRDKLFAKQNGNSSILIERRTETENGIAGSGKRYRVDFTVEKNDVGYKAILQPKEYSTYQQGLILPFAVPKFDDKDLLDNLLTAQLYYKLEIDSEFNTESTHANFMRMLKTRTYYNGEKDPVTGKIFTQHFILPYRDKEVLFVLETYPYRNGSKAVMHLRIPAVLTSPNLVDYKLILDEVKAKLTEVIRA